MNQDLKNLAMELRATAEALCANLSKVETQQYGWKAAAQRARMELLSLSKLRRHFSRTSIETAQGAIRFCGKCMNCTRHHQNETGAWLCDRCKAVWEEGFADYCKKHLED